MLLRPRVRTTRPPARRRRAAAPGRSRGTSPLPGLEPKWPYVRGEFSEPVQCGDLPSRSSKPSPQSFGLWRPKPGSTPSRPGNCTEVASASVSGAISVGARASRPNRSMSRRLPTIPPAASPSSVASRPSGERTASSRYVGNGISVRASTMLRKHDVAGVRVDAALAGPGERLRRIPREAGGMSEQMPHRRAFGTGRLVQVDGALLGRDRGSHRRREASSPSPSRTGARGRRARPTTPPAVATPAAAWVAGPRLDLAQRLQGARY